MYSIIARLNDAPYFLMEAVAAAVHETLNPVSSKDGTYT
jgi:hypothetical protein